MKTSLDFFNDELDNILELYPNEWDEIQKKIIIAKELEKKQLIEFAKYILHQNHEYKSYTDIINEWLKK